MGTFCEYMNPVSVLDYRYGTEEMRNIFRADSYLGFLLDVEATLAEVQETKAIIPKNTSKNIRNATSLVKRERVEEIESEINHDIMAVVKALEEKSGDSGKWIHFGATFNVDMELFETKMERYEFVIQGRWEDIWEPQHTHFLAF